MKKILFFICLIISMFAKSQINLKKEIVPLSCIFVAGIADGLRDNLEFHYDGNSQFWQPDISWRNKYKNGDPAQGRKFPGSTTWLVWTTDGSHLMKFTDNLFTSGAIAFKVNGWKKKKWYWYIVEGGMYWLTNRAGFTIGYNLIKIK